MAFRLLVVAAWMMTAALGGGRRGERANGGRRGERAGGERRGETHTNRCKIRDEDVQFVVDTSQEDWRQHALNGNRSACKRPRDTRQDVRKVLAVGMPGTDAESMIPAYLEQEHQLRHKAIDDKRFFKSVIASKNRDRDPSFYDGAAGERAFIDRAKELLDPYDSFSGIFLSQFTHELLTMYPDALVIAAVRNTTDWLKAMTGRGPPEYDDKVGPVVYGAETFDNYISTKRYVEFYSALVRRVPCCQLLLVDVTRGDAEERLRAFLGRFRNPRHSTWLSESNHATNRKF